MTPGRQTANSRKFVSFHLTLLSLAAFALGAVWQSTAAFSSSDGAWAKLAALIKRAESQCVIAYKKENPTARDVKHVQPSQYSASFILVSLEEAVTVNGTKERKQSFCMVGRRAGKAELAGPLP